MKNNFKSFLQKEIDKTRNEIEALQGNSLSAKVRTEKVKLLSSAELIRLSNLKQDIVTFEDAMRIYERWGRQKDTKNEK